MVQLALNIIGLFWLTFIVYWFVSALFQKKPAEKPVFTMNNILSRVLFTGAFVILIFSEYPYFKQIKAPNPLVVDLIAIIIGFLGLVVCIWARKTIAGNWSNNLDFKKGHELVQNGPYALMRHPIYTGFLLLFIATAIAIGEAGAYLAVVVLLIGVLLRIRQEEALMIKHFKGKYVNYRKKVKALIPGLF